ncbi:MAG: hypothetical protein R3B71_04060 [Candidatus Gracilibacteria bacterium]
MSCSSNAASLLHGSAHGHQPARHAGLHAQFSRGSSAQDRVRRIPSTAKAASTHDQIQDRRGPLSTRQHGHLARKLGRRAVPPPSHQPPPHRSRRRHLDQPSRRALRGVDYKSTCTEKELSLDDEYKQAYKRQAEIYQWLLRQNGFTVNPTAYLVPANGDKSANRFTNKSGTTGNLSFHMSILSHEGDDSLIEQTLQDIKACSDAPEPPPLSPNDTEDLSHYLQELEELTG